MEPTIDSSTLAKGTVWTFAAQVLLKFFSFIYLIVVARLFSTEEIGIFYFVLSIVGFIVIFTDLGFSQSLPTYVPYLYSKGQKARVVYLLKVLFILGFFISIAASFILLFLAPYISSLLGKPELTPALQVLAFFPFVSELSALLGGFLVGRKIIRDYQLVNSFQGIIKIIFTIIFGFIIAFNAVSLSLAYLISFIPLIIGYAYFTLKDIRNFGKYEEDKSVTGRSFIFEVFSFGLILSLTAALYVIASSTDRFMLGVLIKENALEKVGIYSVVTTFAGLVLLPFSAIITIFLPMVSELFGKEKLDEIRKITTVAIKWSIIIGMPFLILLLSFSSFFLRVFYGESYVSGDNVLIVYLLSFAIFSLSLLPMKVIAAMRRLDIELKIAVGCAILNIILNFLFIPLWEMDGAAIATFFSFLLMTILAFYYSKRLFAFSFPLELLPPIFAGLVAFLILYITRQNIIEYISSLPLSIVMAHLGFLDTEILTKFVKLIFFGLLFLLSSVIYFVLLILSRSFGKEEVIIVQKAMRRLKIPDNYIASFTRVLEGRI
ncbi:MAG: flippase [Candidatus Bilamarchaeaceae archaeon]